MPPIYLRVYIQGMFPYVPRSAYLRVYMLPYVPRSVYTSGCVYASLCTLEEGYLCADTSQTLGRRKPLRRVLPSLPVSLLVDSYSLSVPVSLLVMLLSLPGFLPVYDCF